jgi:hypothetical protein
MKAVSRAPSQPRNEWQPSQVSRAACGPALEPMVAMSPPQLQGFGSLTRKPIMGEREDEGVADGGDEDSKKSNCMYVAQFDGTSLARYSRLGLRSPC